MFDQSLGRCFLHWYVDKFIEKPNPDVRYVLERDNMECFNIIWDVIWQEACVMEH